MLGACAGLFRDEPPATELMAALAPFGGGLGSSGRLCGILPGALAVLGFTLGKTGVKTRDHRLLWKLSYAMVRRFDEICAEFGGVNCADIARIDWKDRAAVKIFYRGGPDSTRPNCVRVIRATVLALHDLVSEHFPDQKNEDQDNAS
jgi:hypothetical protein